MIAESLAMNSKPVITRCLPRPRLDVLQPVRDAPAGQTAQPLERQRRAGAVATESFATEVVARFDAYVRVEVEPIAFDGDGGLVGALLVVVLPVISSCLAFGSVATLPRPIAMAAHASIAVCIGGSFDRVLDRPIVEVAMTPQPRSTPALHARDDRLEVLERRRCGRVERARIRSASRAKTPSRTTTWK
jgi:hypothetical protein